MIFFLIVIADAPCEHIFSSGKTKKVSVERFLVIFCLPKIQRHYLICWSFVVNLLCVIFTNLLTSKEVVYLLVFFASRAKRKRWMRKSVHWSSMCPPRSLSDECLLRWPCSPEKRICENGYVDTGSGSQRVKRRKEITYCKQVLVLCCQWFWCKGICYL